MAVESKSESEFILAVDAGGTKTSAWIAECRSKERAAVLGSGRSTAGNPLSVGFAQATRAIAEAVRTAREEAQQLATPVARAVLSVAGSADRETSGKLVAWAHEVGLAERVAIVSDFLPVLAAGTANCYGIALIAGTGSVAFARAADGRTTRCGGWGYLLGDEGSGYAIGRDGIRHALEDLELGAARLPSLSRVVLDKLGADSVVSVERTIYTNAAHRSVVASIAPLVIKAAEAGDVAAQAILDVAAFDLARIVARAARTLGMNREAVPLAVAGGVLVGSKRLQDQVARALHTGGIECELRVVAEPLDGCLRLATPGFCGLEIDWR